jgi:pyruvate dehydrogenase E2 component (dihydrolipoamide acetyltransferase)
MTIKILMPALSPTMTEGNLAKWHVKEGDEVNPGDVIAEIETDKATMEVEAVDEGIVGRILVPEGSEAVAVNKTIGLLLEEDEDNAALDGADTSDPAPVPGSATEISAPAATVAASNAKASPLARRIADQTGVDLSAIKGSGAHGKIVRVDVEAAAGDGKPASAETADISVFGALPEASDADGNRLFASPLARRMAGQAGIDLSGVMGSGPNGRVVKADIDAAIATGATAAMAPTDQSASAPAAAPLKSSEIVKLSTMRKVIASRMIESKTQVPHFYLTMDCELDELLKVRKSLNDGQEDVKISVNDFVIRACAMALMDTPAANVAYESDDEMRQFHTADISVAVAVPGGLITPIVKSAEQKGFRQISGEMKDLATRARDGKLMPEEYQGGSFSVSNLGMFGVKQFDAVINPPQACILAVGAGERRPVVKNSEIVPATVMSATLSVDHRVVDGAIGAELLAAIKRYVENPALMLL